MAISLLDKPPYTPLFPPPVADPDLAQIENWSKQELDTIARLFSAQPGTLFGVNNAPPARPRTGMEAYADGSNWNPGYGEGLYLYKGGVWIPVGVGAGSRIRLSSPTTFYVSTSGSDSNNGLSPSTPWATFGHAMAVLTGQYDFGGQAVTLQAVAGHANFTTPLFISPWTGGGSLTYDGGGGQIHVTNANAITTVGLVPGRFTFQNVDLQTTSFGSALAHVVPGQVSIGTGVVFSGCPTNSPMIAISNSGAELVDSGNYSVTGSAQFFIVARSSPSALLGGLITLTGALTFNGAFCYCTLGGSVFFAGPKPVVSGSVTGLSVSGDTNGMIGVGGRGTSFLPGSGINLGTGAQYL